MTTNIPFNDFLQFCCDMKAEGRHISLLLVKEGFYRVTVTEKPRKEQDDPTL